MMETPSWLPLLRVYSFSVLALFSRESNESSDSTFLGECVHQPVDEVKKLFSKRFVTRWVPTIVINEVITPINGLLNG